MELVPTAAQRDLLLQVIDVAMPADARATVGDGLRHALQRSGYQLCENAHAVIELYSLPLPAAHLYLGPMTLRDALLTLAGPAWDVQVDDRARQICFVPAGEPSADPETDTPLAAPVQTFPSSTEASHERSGPCVAFARGLRAVPAAVGLDGRTQRTGARQLPRCGRPGRSESS